MNVSFFIELGTEMLLVNMFFFYVFIVVREREQRERLRDLSVFERANGNPNKTSRDLAVKKVCSLIVFCLLKDINISFFISLSQVLPCCCDPSFSNIKNAQYICAELNQLLATRKKCENTSFFM